MPKSISFKDKKEATEYAKAMKAQDWEVLQYYDQTTNSWKVIVSQIKDGKTVSAKKIPITMTEIIAYKEEEEALPERFLPRQKKRLVRGSKRYGRQVGGFVAKESAEVLEEAATGRSLKVPLEHTSKRMDVVAGMKRAIPVPGGGRHGYLARIGEMGAAKITEGVGEPARVASMPKPRIGSISESRIAEIGGKVDIGVSREARFQLGVPREMRFRAPRMRRLTVGHPAIPEPEESEVTEA